jgi:predicted O-methyltransferase YrrM
MNTLSTMQVARTLVGLHEKALADHQARALRKKTAGQGQRSFERNWATAYMAVTQEEGPFLHFLATVSRTKNIVEFGCSFVSPPFTLQPLPRTTGDM